jgi:hypothetical protein
VFVAPLRSGVLRERLLAILLAIDEFFHLLITITRAIAVTFTAAVACVIITLIIEVTLKR